MLFSDIYDSVHTYIQTCMHKHMYTHILYMHKTHSNTYTCTHLCIHSHKLKHVHTYLCKHIHTHTCTQIYTLEDIYSNSLTLSHAHISPQPIHTHTPEHKYREESNEMK